MRGGGPAARGGRPRLESGPPGGGRGRGRAVRSPLVRGVGWRHERPTPPAGPDPSHLLPQGDTDLRNPPAGPPTPRPPAGPTSRTAPDGRRTLGECIAPSSSEPVASQPSPGRRDCSPGSGAVASTRPRRTSSSARRRGRRSPPSTARGPPRPTDGPTPGDRAAVGLRCNGYRMRGVLRRRSGTGSVPDPDDQVVRRRPRRRSSPAGDARVACPAVRLPGHGVRARSDRRVVPQAVATAPSAATCASRAFRRPASTPFGATRYARTNWRVRTQTIEPPVDQSRW